MNVIIQVWSVVFKTTPYNVTVIFSPGLDRDRKQPNIARSQISKQKTHTVASDPEHCWPMGKCPVCAYYGSSPACLLTTLLLLFFLKQAVVMSELKNWCLSKLQSMERRFTGDAGKLRRSSSLADTLGSEEGGSSGRGGGGGGGLTTLSGGSHHCLSDSTAGGEGGGGGSGTHPATDDSSANYFVVQVDSSPGS